MNNVIEKVEGKSQTRQAFFERSSIDEENRTVEVAFSSEEPVMRWYGYEVIDHSDGAIDLTRLNSGGAVLVNHDTDDLVGVVDRATIDADRKGRAVLRFGKSERANEIWQDVKDGIRTGISFGYSVNKMTLDSKNDDGVETYRVQVTPFEVSFATVAADSTVGVGRSQEIEPQPVKELQIMTTENTVAEKDPIDPAKELSALREAEKTRVTEIRQMAAKFPHLNNVAERAIEDGKSVDDFSRDLIHAMDKAATRSFDGPITEIGLDKKETEKYSFFRALSACTKNDWRGAELEREVNIAIADQMGKDARGFYLPPEVFSRGKMGTESGITGVEDTSKLKPAIHMGDRFIDKLRRKSVLGGLGMQTLSGLRGKVNIPRKTTDSGFTWIAENGDVAESKFAVDHATLDLKTVTGAIPVTRKLLLQSDPSVEALILNDLVTGMALAIDDAGINGTGSSDQPYGVIKVAKSFITAALTPTFAETVAFETMVEEANAEGNALNWIVKPSIKGAWKTQPVDAGSGIMTQTGNLVNGYNVVSNTVMKAATPVVFGDFSQLLFGTWGVLEINPDAFTYAASGGLVIRSFMSCDFAVRHPESFVYNKVKTGS